MILFDGIYSLASVGLSLLSVIGSNYMSKRDDEKYPFGKRMIEPVIIIIKSLAIFIMCIYSLSGALVDFLSGGNEVQYGFALVYAVISTVGCGITYIFLRRKGKYIDSNLLLVEGNQWLMDTLLSLGVLVGFLLANILQYTELGWFNRYMDPLMVILCSTIFIRMPLKALMQGFKELFEFRADDNIALEIKGLVSSIEEAYNFEEAITRVSKSGRNLRIEIDFIYNDNSSIKILDDMDDLRETIFDSLKHIGYDKWLNVSFTKDKKWAI